MMEIVVEVIMKFYPSVPKRNTLVKYSNLIGPGAGITILQPRD
jgi:hypothetical protein